MTFTGEFTNQNWYRVFKDGKLFSHKRSYKYVKHSPDGFSWEYFGSGPSQLAFAILLEYTNDPKLCMKVYQDFKVDVIAKLPKDGSWTLTDMDVHEWFTKKLVDTMVKLVKGKKMETTS